MPRNPLIMSAFLLFAVTQAPAGDETQKELASLQGEWAIIGKEFKGKKATEQEVKRLTGKTIIKGDKLTNWVDDAGKEMVVSVGTLKLTPTLKPKALDLAWTEGFEKGSTTLAIYELSGDVLKVCYTFEGEGRPNEFAGRADGLWLFLTYKRQKK